MRCERLHATLTEQACIRRQEDARNHSPPTICATCEQGRAVAELLGVTVQAKQNRYAVAAARGLAQRRRAGRPRKGETIWSSHYDPNPEEVDDVSKDQTA